MEADGQCWQIRSAALADVCNSRNGGCQATLCIHLAVELSELMQAIKFLLC